MPAGLRPSPPDHFSAYKERHANGALKIRLATMASHKARDGLSPRAQARSCAAARSKLIVRSCDRPPSVTHKLNPRQNMRIVFRSTRLREAAGGHKAKINFAYWRIE